MASVRAGNVIGGGDMSKDRIIPDCVRNYREKKILSLEIQRQIDLGNTFFQKIIWIS